MYLIDTNFLISQWSNIVYAVWNCAEKDLQHDDINDWMTEFNKWSTPQSSEQRTRVKDWCLGTCWKSCLSQPQCYDDVVPSALNGSYWYSKQFQRPGEMQHSDCLLTVTPEQTQGTTGVERHLCLTIPLLTSLPSSWNVDIDTSRCWLTCPVQCTRSLHVTLQFLLAL